MIAFWNLVQDFKSEADSQYTFPEDSYFVCLFILDILIYF